MSWHHEVIQDNGDLGKMYEVTEVVEEGTSPRVLYISTLDEAEIPALIDVAINPQIIEPSPDDVVDQFRRAIQRLIDTHAQSRRYDSGNSLATYVTSSNPDWAAEAQAFVVWRDAVWAYAYVELDKVLAGEREQPSVDAILGELPELVWPS